MVSEKDFDNKAKQLLSRYDSISFQQAHSSWEKLYNFKGKKVLDIGCGSGRDAIYINSQGGTVTAIDFSQKLLNLAKTKDVNNQIEWLHDSLPKLKKLHTLYKSQFDFILISAVLMFLSNNCQLEAISNVLPLINDAGSIVLTIKTDTNDNSIFPISESLFEYVKLKGFSTQVLDGGKDQLNRSGVEWKVIIIKKV